LDTKMSKVLSEIRPLVVVMGAKHSKKKAAEQPGAWAVTEVGALEGMFAVVSLERSTSANRMRNTLGLPDDVIGLIATYLEVGDLGRVARVCKTWRRISFKDSVWRHFARRMHMDPGPDDDLRSAVVFSVLVSRSSFMRAPLEMQPAWQSYLTSRGRGTLATVTVCVTDTFDPNSFVRAGKSAIAARQSHNVFASEHSTTVTGSYQQAVQFDHRDLLLGVLDHRGGEDHFDWRRKCYREADAFLICGLFDRSGAVQAVDQIYRMIVDEKQDHYSLRRTTRAPVILVRTQSDLNLPCPEAAKLLKWAEEHGSGFVSTSSKTGENVQEAFFFAIRLALVDMEDREREKLR
jgi:hypothetical protein